MVRSVSQEPVREGMPNIFPLPLERHAEAAAMPVPRTSFVGREREVEQVQALLHRDDVRLVTLTGPGGVGKTRVSIKAVSALPHPAQFVDLAEVQQPALVLPTIAAALGVRPEGRPVLDNLRAALRDDHHLLVLDNFEQVLPAAVTLVDLLDACPNVKILTSSRVVLGIPGEHVVDIRPFPLPPAGSGDHAMDARDFDACRLFADRSRALDPDFVLSGSNAQTIVNICQRLDGLPLAIELAAAWVAVLSPAALLAQLENRLALPSGSAPGVPQRHQSLRDTISWSYGLLSEASQALFRRVAVCNGGCSLDAVQKICGDGTLDVLQELRTLVANSLVRRSDVPSGESQYIMLELVREFGVERLEQSPEADLIRHRHATYFLALAEHAEAMQNTIEREIWLDQLEADQGNLHSAMSWAIAQEEAEIALRLCAAMLPYWQFRFHAAVGLDLVRRALALGKDVSPPVLRKALFCAGTLAYMEDERTAAAQYFADALLLYQEANDPEMTGRVELALGRMAWDDDDLAAARQWFDTAKQQFADSGDEVGLAHILHYEGLVAFKDGDNALAEACLRDALARWQTLGFTWELAQCIPGHLADIARVEGKLADAMILYQECLSFNWERQYLEDVSWSLAGLALVASMDGQVDQSARLMALADRIEERLGAMLTYHIGRLHDVALATIKERVGAERFAAMQATVRSADLSAEIAAALALTMGQAGECAATQPDSGLTQREREVLRMMASGMSNREIAESLFVSLGTVKVHVTHILGKLDVKSRSAATDYAHRHDLA